MSVDCKMFQICLLIIWALSDSSGFRLKPFNQENKFEWAVLVAGSNGWGNYRHQADVCHAYHILRANGISEDHIITFMYDDIANHPENPFPGKIFNDYSHKDYYEGVKIDYKRRDVNVNNFKGVLLGSPELKEQGMKVLESGPEDDVFVYFTDHGGDYTICFPDEEMTATELNKTITQMYEKNMYKNFVLYLEACESGSMFENIISPHIKVFTTTAAKSGEPSWASFCDDVNISSCLADEYSHNWMQDTETHETHKRTLREQFLEVKHKTKKSHVQKFGNFQMQSLPLGDFQGDNLDHTTLNSNKVMENMDLVPSRHAKIHMLQKRLQNNQKPEDSQLIQRRLERLLQLNKMAIDTFADIEQLVKKNSPSLTVQTIHDWLPCYESVQRKYTDLCFKIQKVPAVAENLSRMVQLCKEGYEAQAIENAITLTCE